MFDEAVRWDIGETEAVAVAVEATAFRRRRKKKKKIKRTIAAKATPPATVPPAMAPIFVMVSLVANDTEAVDAKFGVADAAVDELPAVVPRNDAAMLGFEDKYAAAR